MVPDMTAEPSGPGHSLPGLETLGIFATCPFCAIFVNLQFLRKLRFCRNFQIRNFRQVLATLPELVKLLIDPRFQRNPILPLPYGETLKVKSPKSYGFSAWGNYEDTPPRRGGVSERRGSGLCALRTPSCTPVPRSLFPIVSVPRFTLPLTDPCASLRSARTPPGVFYSARDGYPPAVIPFRQRYIQIPRARARLFEPMKGKKPPPETEMRGFPARPIEVQEGFVHTEPESIARMASATRLWGPTTGPG